MSSAVTRSFNSISFGSLSITQYQCLPMASRLRSACVYEKGFSDCGRDVHYWTPPAQIRTCGVPAYGSRLGCLTAKRSLSDLPYVAQRLGHAFPVLCPARAVLTPCGQKIKTAGKTRGYPIPAPPRRVSSTRFFGAIKGALADRRAHKGDLWSGHVSWPTLRGRWTRSCCCGMSIWLLKTGS